MAKRKKELELIDSSFYSLTANDGDFYFKDNEGNIYCWHTASDKAFEWLMDSSTEKRICTFTESYKWDNPKYGTVIKIKNVRF